MENENIKHPADEGQKNGTAGSGRSRNRRRRHHRGGHSKSAEGKVPAERKEPQESVAAPTAVDKRPAENQKNTQGGNNGNRSKSRKHKRGGKGDGQDRHDNRRGVEKRPYSPYEEPSADELSLEELRARIVLNPSLPSSNEVAARSAFAERASEPIEITDEMVASLPPLGEVSGTASEPEEKVEVVGIRFRSAGKTYFFDPRGLRASKGQYAIVETARGPEFGDVCLGNTMVSKKETVSPLRPILRIATAEDIACNEENRKKEKEALSVCQKKILEHKLDMKLIDVQYAFDRSKLLFYFTSEGRVDFRELVKDLASVFRTRIELRQIGIRDEAKMLGGLGACGRTLCCSTFLPDFAQVSIKMAKEQNLSLNSTKISGLCGRLMCCLRFESDVYAEEIKKTPPVDAVVKTEDGVGFVISTNPLAGTVRVVLKDTPDVAPKQYHRNEVTILERNRKKSGDKANGKNGEKKSSEES